MGKNEIATDELGDGLIEAGAEDLKELARWLPEHRQGGLSTLRSRRL